LRFKDLFDFRGRIGRAPYGLTVLTGVLILHNVSRIFTATFQPQYRSLNFWLPVNILGIPRPFPPQLEQSLPLFALLVTTFIWLLIVMTLKRLRDLETTEWYVFLLFVPVLNVFFFLLLCLQPRCESLEHAQRKGNSFLESLLPHSSWGSAILGALAGAIVATLFSLFAVVVLGRYGGTLFLALPFFMGYTAAWLHSYREPRNAAQCCGVALASILLASAFIVGIAFEGLICVAMAIPLAAPLAVIGGLLAHMTQKPRTLQAQPTAMLSLCLVLPLLAGAESWKPASTPQHEVHSSVDISAPAQVVWQRIVTFPRIEEKPHWILRLGMAYPIQATTIGTGLTADRQTTFSTGISREPVLAWQEGKHFAFRVAEEPPLMKESSPYGTIRVRHLEDHDFRPGRVDFYLTELPGGHTRVDCWSSYKNRMWPGEYWQIWTDEIVRQIQLRVFHQVKRLAEADQRLSTHN
jgi:uncharacterized membrane protein YhaH (DUF805 family)